MALSRGELMAPARAAAVQYVYVKMLTNTVDTNEGKLRRGQVIAIPYDKATRWCFRSQIARPASKEEFERYQDRLENDARRSGGGFRRRPARRSGVDIPERDPFEYVEQPDFNNVDEESIDDDGEGDEVTLTGGSNLSDRLSGLGQSTAQQDDDEDDDEDNDPMFPGDVRTEQEPEAMNFGSAITRGPGETADSGRQMRRARGRGAKPDDNSAEPQD